MASVSVYALAVHLRRCVYSDRVGEAESCADSDLVVLQRELYYRFCFGGEGTVDSSQCVAA